MGKFWDPLDSFALFYGGTVKCISFIGCRHGIAVEFRRRRSTTGRRRNNQCRKDDRTADENGVDDSIATALPLYFEL